MLETRQSKTYTPEDTFFHGESELLYCTIMPMGVMHAVQGSHAC